MPGRHASADRGRFRRDLRRMITLVLVSLVIVVVVALGIRFLLGRSEGLGSGGTTAPTSTSADPSPSEPATTTTARPSTTVPSTTSTVPTTTLTATTTTTTSPVREPAQLTVLVLNSTRTGGLAGRVTDRLSGLGYRTVEPGNHPSLLDVSVVWFVDGFEREAEVLAESIPDANVEPFSGDNPRAPLTVVVGASFRE